MDYAQEQADEIEALDSIYTGYFDKLTDAPPFKVSPGRMRPRSADDGVRSPQSSRAREHAFTARRFRGDFAGCLGRHFCTRSRPQRHAASAAAPCMHVSMHTVVPSTASWRRLTCVLA
jgi:hypothetical protein